MREVVKFDVTDVCARSLRPSLALLQWCGHRVPLHFGMAVLSAGNDDAPLESVEITLIYYHVIAEFKGRLHHAQHAVEGYHTQLSLFACGHHPHALAP